MAAVADLILGEVIGKGSQSRIFKAQWKGEWVALKALDSCHEEYKLTEESSCRPPNVLQVLEVFNSYDGQTCLIMPLMAGGSIRSIIENSFRNGLNEEVIRGILFETLVALEHIHRHGGVYGTKLHPGKILLGLNGNIKLAPFIFSSVGFSDFPAGKIFEQQEEIKAFGVTALQLIFGHLTQDRVPIRESRNNPSYLCIQMIKYCLLPSAFQRPTAKNLLKHKFFSPHNMPFLIPELLVGLPPLEHRQEFDSRMSIFSTADGWKIHYGVFSIQLNSRVATPQRTTRATSQLLGRTTQRVTPHALLPVQEQEQEQNAALRCKCNCRRSDYRLLLWGFVIAVFHALIALGDFILNIIRRKD